MNGAERRKWWAVGLLVLLLGGPLSTLAQSTTRPSTAPATRSASRPATRAATGPAGTKPELETVEVTAIGGGMENGPPTVFLISRTGNASRDLVVHYELGGTSTEGADHIRMARQLLIPRGFRTATLIVPTLDDQDAEGEETVTLTILPPPAQEPEAPGQPAATQPVSRPTPPTRPAGDAPPRP